MSNQEAMQLLLSATEAMQTGATVLSGELENGTIERQLAGYVEISSDSEWGSNILERWSEKGNDDPVERDNVTRWTLIDRGDVAKIVLECYEIEDEEGNIVSDFGGKIAFEYPKDRDCLMVVGHMQWLMVRVGLSEPGELHHGSSGMMAKRKAGRDHQLIEISTGNQVREMLRIMDDRNPGLRKRTIKEIADHLEVARSRDDELQFLDKLGTTIDELTEILKNEKHPLRIALGIFNTIAIHSVLTSDGPQTTKQLCEKVELDEKYVERALIANFQSDHPFVWGREENGEWYWVKDASAGDSHPLSSYEGLNLHTADGRLQAAKRLLNEAGIEIPLHEISPAMALASKIINQQGLENSILALINKKTPVWAQAKGFAKTYESCLLRARGAKAMGIDEIDGLTMLQVQVGHSLRTAHVLTMTSAQVSVLPSMDMADAQKFMQTTSLPFDPLFLDFTADEHLPRISRLIKDNEGEEAILNVDFLGALIDSTVDGNVVFITPIFYYTDRLLRSKWDDVINVNALGSVAINKSGVANYRFPYVFDSGNQFQDDIDMVTLVSPSATLAKHPEIQDFYHDIVWNASRRVISALYFIEAANVEMVPLELTRRDKKRQEKRNWLIPLTVRVNRPSRRTHNHRNGNGEAREYSHQFEVIGHYRHVTKGSHVACIVCNGKTTEDLVCPRCNGTGLDPDKVKPCERIDVKTGEKTCPNGCRREFCPSYVKGDPDKPLVIKTRLIK